MTDILPTGSIRVPPGRRCVAGLWYDGLVRRNVRHGKHDRSRLRHKLERGAWPSGARHRDQHGLGRYGRAEFGPMKRLWHAPRVMTGAMIMAVIMINTARQVGARSPDFWWSLLIVLVVIAVAFTGHVAPAVDETPS
jgi:hypothetical protein